MGHRGHGASTRMAIRRSCSSARNDRHWSYGASSGGNADNATVRTFVASCVHTACRPRVAPFARAFGNRAFQLRASWSIASRA